MKILSVYVARFGKIQDQKFDFSPDSVNLIVKNNGMGKSTLAHFIRAMFYGLNYTRAQGKNDVLRFTPWNSADKFGGSLTYEDGGKKFLIERFFQKTERDEEGTLRDLSSGKILPLIENGVQIGEKLFNLSAEAFMRCIFVPQQEIVLGEVDFSTRLSRLIEGGGNAAADTAIENLRNFAKIYKKERGRGGSIDAEAERRQGLFRDLEAAKTKLQRIEDNAARLPVLQQIADTLRGQCARQKAAELQSFQINANLRAEADNAKERLTSLEKQYEAVKMQAQSAAASAQKLKELEQKCAAASVGISAANAKLEAIQSKKYSSAPLMLISFVLAAACAIACIILPNLLVPLLILGVALALNGAILAANIQKNKQILYKRKIIEQEIRGAAQKEAEYKSQSAQIAAEFGGGASDDMFNLAARGENLQKELFEAQKRFSAAQAGLAAAQSNGGDLQNFDATEQFAKTEREIVRINAENAELARELPDISAITGEIELSKECEKALEQKYSEIISAADFLRQAKEELSTDFLPRMNEFINECIERVTDGEYSGAAVDNKMNLELSGGGRMRPIDSFSCGIREAALFCLRLALSEKIYSGKIPLMILDDPLVNLDEQKLAAAVGILKEFNAKGTQIIYFSKNNIGF